MRSNFTGILGITAILVAVGALGLFGSKAEAALPPGAIVITFDNGSGNPSSYTEAGLTASGSRFRFRDANGDGSQGIEHLGRSRPIRFSMGGAPFTVLSVDVDRRGSRNLFRSSAGGRIDDPSVGTLNFPASGWTNITHFDWRVRTRATIDDLVIISNQPPVCTDASADPDSLWPANHKMKPVSVDGVTDPDGDVVSIAIDTIMQDEPVNGQGDGDTGPDGQGVGTDTAQVRAERSSQGNGRVYEIGFTASDGRGGTCSGMVEVGVPHNQGKGAKGGPAVNDGAIYDSTRS